MNRNYLLRTAFLAILPIWLINCSNGQTITNNYDPNAAKPKLKTDRFFLYQPQKDWTYSHHPHITFFNGQFYAIWSNGLKDEDAVGQRILLSKSSDFNKWAEPNVLAEPNNNRVLTAAGFHQYNGTLVAYFGDYGAKKENTELFAVTTTDGNSWSPRQSMGIPVNPNHGPQKTASGRLIICGNISFPYTDDPAGLSGWKMAGIYPKEMSGISDNPDTFSQVQEKMGWPVGLCEGSFYQTDDNTIHMLLRSTGTKFRGRLWLTESSDNGQTWSGPVETNFTDNCAKFHFGRLPDKRFYSVSCPTIEPPYVRTPLVLSISSDGIAFDKHYIIADEIYQKKVEGLCKDGQYGYPHTMIHDGYMYIIVSRLKEAVEVIRISLDQLEDKAVEPADSHDDYKLFI